MSETEREDTSHLLDVQEVREEEGGAESHEDARVLSGGGEERGGGGGGEEVELTVTTSGGGEREGGGGGEGEETIVPSGGRENGEAGEAGEAGEDGEDGEIVDDTEEKFTLHSAASFIAGDTITHFIPGVPLDATVTCHPNPRRGIPQFKITLEHGPFQWTIHKFYREFLSLRRDLYPMRMRIRRGRRGRGRQRGYLPHLLSAEDINPRLGVRLRNQLPKVQRFINAVLKDGQLYRHPSTLKFLQVSRFSFLEDLGSKRREGLVTKRSGGHRRVTNCLGCTACCVCRYSVWQQRWFVLKDSFVAYVRYGRGTVAGVLLFDEATTVEVGIRQTHLRHGLKIITSSRELLMKCSSHRSTREWRDAIQEVLNTTGKVWVEKKRFDSFAPVRDNCTVKWFVDAEKYMLTVARAMLDAKDEIFITDWMLSPHLFLKREDPPSLEWRLDHILLKKANEGVRVYIQLYKEVLLALDLGSEFVMQVLKHPNIVIFRHPDHIQAGIYLWAHHEKLVIIDQTLAFIGGIDLAYGRWDNCCHHLTDNGRPHPKHVTELAVTAVSAPRESSPPSAGDAEDVACRKLAGKDYYNPFIKDFIELTDPFTDQLDRSTNPRMPWHDIASCVYGAPARDVARHFIQRHNFTKRDLSSTADVPFLMPRQAFTEHELEETKYLLETIPKPTSSNATVQILRSAGEWSAGVPTEQSILHAYMDAIEKAEHFIYIENQFFISHLPSNEVHNGISEALRLRIARAHKEGKKFRVIIVMPLLPSFEGVFGERSGTVLEAVIHWNYKTISRGEESLYSRLHTLDGIDKSEIENYVSVYGLRTHEIFNDKPITEIVYVHSKCMIVDDKLTIIGSANVNDRSMRGDRDSEVAILVQDNDLVEGRMNGEPYMVGKFSHSLRCQLFKEHLGLLDERTLCKDIDVQDPVCDEFYQTWVKSAKKNLDIYEEVFGGKSLPTDKVLNYQQLKIYEHNIGIEDADRAKQLLAEMQGRMVPMPLRFLEEENLLPSFGTKEAFAPTRLVT